MSILQRYLACTNADQVTLIKAFCLQDTYFKTWQDNNPAARDRLAGLLYAMTESAGVRPQVRSSNPDIEASIRSGGADGYLFVINHEAATPEVEITLRELGFEIKKIIDLATGMSISFETGESPGLLCRWPWARLGCCTSSPPITSFCWKTPTVSRLGRALAVEVVPLR